MCPRRVDVAHLILYHLSVCCNKKYFDLEREILPFANAHWDALLLGQVGGGGGAGGARGAGGVPNPQSLRVSPQLAQTPKGERRALLLGALSAHKDRCVRPKTGTSHPKTPPMSPQNPLSGPPKSQHPNVNPKPPYLPSKPPISPQNPLNGPPKPP